MILWLGKAWISKLSHISIFQYSLFWYRAHKLMEQLSSGHHSLIKNLCGEKTHTLEEWIYVFAIDPLAILFTVNGNHKNFTYFFSTTLSLAEFHLQHVVQLLL